jgi:hypothetical protein
MYQDGSAQIVHSPRVYHENTTNEISIPKLRWSKTKKQQALETKNNRLPHHSCQDWMLWHVFVGFNAVGILDGDREEELVCEIS